ncbi:MAG: hypothetical protein LBP70_00505 [Mycoplasmataceae bacterium]|nr:hypothetical protein [Mycoplasmataceae bacterium]
MMKFKMGETTEIWQIKTMSSLVAICTIAFFSSVLGEIIANPNDRIFILSRPVKRSTYLTSKLLLSATFAIVVASIISAYYLILDQWCQSKHISLYQGKMKLSYMIVVSFMLCLLGSLTGTSFRYYCREMIVSVIVLVVSMSYAIGFSFGVTQNPDQANDLEYLETFLIPLAAMLPTLSLAVGIGFVLNYKINIGS